MKNNFRYLTVPAVDSKDGKIIKIPRKYMESGFVKTTREENAAS